ncbi:MAG: hypothetical protein JSU04_18610 [Bdellovibrionales bacterium]|nr:hypothetical protein [Bdellovibrionales bacterium]
MSFQNLEAEFKKIETQIPTVESDLPFYAFERIKSNSLNEQSSANQESKILDGPLQLVTQKKSLRLEFKRPAYIHTINLHNKGALGTRRVQIIYYGCDPSKRNSEFKTINPFKEQKEIVVNGVVVAIEINTTKPLAEIISEIEIHGDLNFDPSDFQDKLSNYFQNLSTSIQAFRKNLSQALVLTNSGVNLENNISGLKTEEGRLHKINEDLSSKKQELESNLEELMKKNESLNTNLNSLRGEYQALDNNINNLKSEIATKQDEKYRAQIDLDNILNKKNFYNSTLEGFKSETRKNFAINLALSLLLIGLAKVLCQGAMTYYEHALEQIQNTTEPHQLYTITALRLGAGAIFLTAFYWLFELIKNTVKNTLNLVTDTRNIEAKLILARNTAETVLKGEPDSEKRNYASFLSFVVLKNHFMNMSFESLSYDLEIDANTLDKVAPVLPEKFGIKDIISSVTTISKKSSQSAEETIN